MLLALLTTVEWGWRGGGGCVNRLLLPPPKNQNGIPLICGSNNVHSFNILPTPWFFGFSCDYFMNVTRLYTGGFFEGRGGGGATARASSLLTLAAQRSYTRPRMCLTFLWGDNIFILHVVPLFYKILDRPCIWQTHPMMKSISIIQSDGSNKWVHYMNLTSTGRRTLLNIYHSFFLLDFIGEYILSEMLTTITFD